MTDAVVMSACRSQRRVLCSNSAPAPSATAPAVGEDTGVYSVTDAPNVELSGQQGSFRYVKFGIGGLTSNTPTLRVFGWARVAGPIHGAAATSAVWVPYLIYKATAAHTIAPGGDAVDDVLEAGEYMAGAITQDALVPAATATAISGGSDGLSSVRLDVTGYPYLSFVSSREDTFVFVGQYT